MPLNGRLSLRKLKEARTPQSKLTPSTGAVPRPNSSSKTSELALASSEIFATALRSALSALILRLSDSVVLPMAKTRSVNPTKALFAGTGLPICAI
ncbi:hypothetical protein H4S03_004656 [Coemansia sp. S3946]|nr:hypothetical protein H4S03_004656 [Coemansia sp. S3946]